MSASIISRRGLVAGLALIAATPSRIYGQGFAGLGNDAGEFAPVVPGRTLTFPVDHGAHPDFRIEWWYLTANLTDDEGNSWGAQWTLFRQAMHPGPQREGWANQQIWMGHAAITSADLHMSSERFARGGVGQAGVTAAPLHAFLDDWTMKANEDARADIIAPMRVQATSPDFSYTLDLSSSRPLVLQGDNGYSRKSERGQASYYYSQPYFTARGTIKTGSRTIAVSGRAWMDREWSSQPLSSDQTGWDWFSLHLADGRKLMLFRLRERTGDSYFAGNLIGTKGSSETLASDAIRMTPLVTTKIGERHIPTEWRIEVLSAGISLETTPLNPRAWMDTTFAYWEGPVTARGSQSAIGYLEMTGY